MGEAEEWLLRNKVSLLLVAVGLIVIATNFFLVSDGRFFIIGNDPSRHLTVIESFIENRGIVFPVAEGRDYAAYIYYTPLFHLSIAVVSIMTGIQPIILQNLVPLVCLLFFYWISYKILKLLFKDSEKALFASTIMLFFFPVPVPNPHYIVYYALLPLAAYLLMKLFDKKTIIGFGLLFLTILAIGLIHSQSMLFYFASLSFSIILGIFFFQEARHLRTLLLIWLVSAVAYVITFFIFSFITPTFWEAILHYFSIQLISLPVEARLEQIYLSTGPNIPLILVAMLIVPVAIFGVLYTIAPFIVKARQKSSEKILNILGEKKSQKISYALLIAPLAIIFAVLAYILLWNLFFNVFQFIAVYVFQPALPYFARISAMNAIYWAAFFGKSGFEVFMFPYMLGLLILFFFSAYSVFAIISEKELAKRPYALVFIIFMVPFYFSIISLPFINLSSIISALIIDRFFYYTYPMLVFFSAPVIIKIVFLVEERWGATWKEIIPFIALGAVFVLINAGTFFSSSYSIDPVQNEGYRWLIETTAVSENEPELNFDVLGYYHISKFPTHYSMYLLGQETIMIDLIREELTYRPEITINVFGVEKSTVLEVYWIEHEIKEDDEKIFDNPQIGFYYEGM